MFLDAIDVRRAFGEDEFFPFFQPLIELRTGLLTGFEVLARWNHARLGSIAPDAFIPIVQKSGLINTLTQRILEKVFAAAPLVHSSLRLSINLAPPQLLDFTLPARIAAAAARGNFPLTRLTIEITETALMDDLPRAQEVARDLKARGCRLALDDFGTGSSSLNNLHALPFDELKVDGSFVRMMTKSPECRKIVSAVVGLGQGIGLNTVAEGVETEEQASLLNLLGCNLGQGWLYGKPASAEEIPGMVAAPPRLCATCLPAAADADASIDLGHLPARMLAQLVAIYDGLPAGLCFLDRDLRYVSVNRQLARMNDRPIAAHLGMTASEVVSRTWPQIEPYVRRALEGHSAAGIEIRESSNRHGLESGENGSKLLLSCQPARNDAGEVVGVAVVVMDSAAAAPRNSLPLP
jgi:EAL domain-containing protein (putative c-di-GMP-specific phosphodiesterase class I)